MAKNTMTISTLAFLIPTVAAPLLSVILFCGPTSAQDFYAAPIDYENAPVSDRVFQLKQALDSGAIQLKWDEKTGWLKDLLGKLEIEAASQTLVYSKTSLQIRKISPRNPRAIFFNDDTYVGYVPGGDLIEISAVDDKQGAIFYTIDSVKKPNATIARDHSNCMTCHGTTRTQRVPGYLVRSVFPRPSGQPAYGMGTTTVDHRTKFSKRFGGWYVTGKHGSMTHRGNATVMGNDMPQPVAEDLNRDRLPKLVKTDRYPVGTSDIVALMILEHQSQMHNFITRASYETRQALHYQQVMNTALERESDFISESTRRRVASAGDDLLSYLLFRDEAELTAGIQGHGPFANHFESQGPRDSQGRSLRRLNLKTRLLEFPCSYLIYSDSFQSLPKMISDYVLKRLAQILLDYDKSEDFQHLSVGQRQAILEILCETKAGFQAVVDQERARHDLKKDN